MIVLHEPLRFNRPEAIPEAIFKAIPPHLKQGAVTPTVQVIERW